MWREDSLRQEERNRHQVWNSAETELQISRTLRLQKVWHGAQCRCEWGAQYSEKSRSRVPSPRDRG